MKKHAPATIRNREAILAVLRHELPEWGTVLEVASGSGEHAVYFADQMRALSWQPSDPDPEALASIGAYRADYDGVNLHDPVKLDASAPGGWPLERADAMFCANMIHISPWDATVGLFAGAGRLLDREAALILYGPFLEEEVEPAPSNLAFDASLKSRNPQWGLREVSKLDALADENQLARVKRYEMPANNLMLIYRKTS